MIEHRNVKYIRIHTEAPNDVWMSVWVYWVRNLDVFMCTCVYYRIVSLRSTSYRCYIHQFHIEHFAFIVLWCVSSPYRIHKTGIFSPILSQFSSTWYIHWRIYRKQYRELEQWPKQCVFVYLTSVKRKER